MSVSLYVSMCVCDGYMHVYVCLSVDPGDIRVWSVWTCSQVRYVYPHEDLRTSVVYRLERGGLVTRCLF